MNCYLLATILYLVYDSTVAHSIMAGSSSYLSSCPMIMGPSWLVEHFPISACCFRKPLPKSTRFTISANGIALGHYPRAMLHFAPARHCL